jgi:hypothetical protein
LALIGTQAVAAIGATKFHARWFMAGFRDKVYLCSHHKHKIKL